MLTPSTKVWNVLRWGCIAYLSLLCIFVVDDLANGAIFGYLGLSCGGGCFKVYSDVLGNVIIPDPVLPGAQKIDGGWYVRVFFLGIFIAWFRWINLTRPEQYRDKEDQT